MTATSTSLLQDSLQHINSHHPLFRCQSNRYTQKRKYPPVLNGSICTSSSFCVKASRYTPDQIPQRKRKHGKWKYQEGGEKQNLPILVPILGAVVAASFLGPLVLLVAGSLAGIIIASSISGALMLVFLVPAILLLGGGLIFSTVLGTLSAMVSVAIFASMAAVGWAFFTNRGKLSMKSLNFAGFKGDSDAAIKSSKGAADDKTFLEDERLEKEELLDFDRRLQQRSRWK